MTEAKGIANMQAFRQWIDIQPDAYLRDQLVDMYWKGTLKGTELRRAFYVEWLTDGRVVLVPSRFKKG